MKKIDIFSEMKCECGGSVKEIYYATGVFDCVCERCGHIMASVNCPYIPMDIKAKPIEHDLHNKIDVLNGGYVRLVDHMGDDLSIVRSARVSYDAEWRAGEDAGKDEKLISYLWKNRHTSPFEAVTFTFEVKAPIFVFRQWHRHRTWSFNEVSARYTELDMGSYLPALDQITTQSTSNKQMRTTEQHPEASSIQRTMFLTIQRSIKTYKRLVDKGAPRELARIVLPVACYSKMFATIDLHNLLHFLTLRCHSHAQYEIRVYAEGMLKLIEPIVPFAVKVFREGNNGVTT